jgi:hypothetical protein
MPRRLKGRGWQSPAALPGRRVLSLYLNFPSQGWSFVRLAVPLMMSYRHSTSKREFILPSIASIYAPLTCALRYHCQG